MFGVYPSWEFILKAVRHSRPRRHRPPWAGRLTPTPLVGSRKKICCRVRCADLLLRFDVVSWSAERTLRDWVDPNHLHAIHSTFSDRLNSLLRVWGGAAIIAASPPGRRPVWWFCSDLVSMVFTKRSQSRCSSHRDRSLTIRVFGHVKQVNIA